MIEAWREGRGDSGVMVSKKGGKRVKKGGKKGVVEEHACPRDPMLI